MSTEITSQKYHIFYLTPFPNYGMIPLSIFSAVFDFDSPDLFQGFFSIIAFFNGDHDGYQM